MNKLVSIIVPVYKVEKYLNKCVDSILNQSYRNIEIILVDDGSPDNSGVICDEYASDPKVKVIHQENMGLSGARNTGIDNSKGDYLMFIDSDDYIDKDMVQYLVDKSEQKNADIVICDYYNVIDDEIKRNSYPATEFTVRNKSKYEYLFNEYTIVTVIACNKLYRRHIFDEIRYPVGKTNEDEYVIADVLSKAECICYSLKPLYYYIRQREDSIMNSYTDKKFDYIYAFDHRTEFFDENGLYELRDLNKYSSALVQIKRMNEYIQLCSNPSVSLITEKLNDTEQKIRELCSSQYLSFVRKAKMKVYDAIPSVYNRKIKEWIMKNS